MFKFAVLATALALGACAQTPQVTLHDKGIIKNATFTGVSLVVDEGSKTSISDTNFTVPSDGQAAIILTKNSLVSGYGH